MSERKRSIFEGLPGRPAEPHKNVTTWFLQQIRDGTLRAGDILTVQQIADKGNFRVGTVRKGIAELASLGFVECVRSVGTRVLPLAAQNCRARGRLFVGVLSPPSASMLPELLDGMRSELEEASRENGLKPPVILSLWPNQPCGGLSPEQIRSFTGVLDCVLALPASNPAESAVYSAITAAEIPLIAVESPVHPFSTQCGTTAAEHLVGQLRRFGDKSRTTLPPIFVFSEHPHPDSLNSLQGCRDVLLSVSGLFWNPGEHIRHPGDSHTARWAPGNAPAEAWRAPQLYGETAGRFFAVELIDSTLFCESPGPDSFRPPSCGIICLSEGVARGAIECFEKNGIQVGTDVFVVAVDLEGRKFDAFVTRVQTNYRKLGGQAATEAIKRLLPSALRPLTEPALPMVTVRRRRSTGDFLHKLWRANPGPTVIKDLNKRVQYANPMLEDLRGLSTAQMRGKTPPEVWGQEEGLIIEDHDDVVRKTGQPHLSCEWLPYHKGGGTRFTFRFPILLNDRFDFIGTMGFDILDVHLEPQRLVINPSNEQDDPEDGPSDEVIEAYFECMPCSVLVRRHCHTILYANAQFADLVDRRNSGPLFGETPAPILEHYVQKNEADSHTLFFEEDLLPGESGVRRVVRFPLLNAFFRKEADASIGFHASVLTAAKRMLGAVDTTRPFAGMIVPLVRDNRHEGHLVRDIDLDAVVARARPS